MEDIGEMILQLRRQVESLFSIKYGKLPAARSRGAFAVTSRVSCRCASADRSRAELQYEFLPSLFTDGFIR